MPNLRFIHSADLHLDSPFKGLRSQAPEHVAQQLQEATFEAYKNIIDLCVSESVDALLVAGDIYDGADRSLRAQWRFFDGLKRLSQAGIRSFICHGNHDPLDGWEARLTLPDGCFQFGPLVEAVPLAFGNAQEATVYGISYPTREVRQNLTPQFAAAQSHPHSGFKIGLLHANVGGNQEHDSYAPCSVAELAATGIDYWALGHVHTRQTLQPVNPTVVYPGNPQGRHANETGARGVYLVEVDEGGTPHLEFCPVDVVRWATLQLDIGGMETEQALLDRMDDMVREARAEAEGRCLVARLELVGRGPMHRTLNDPAFVVDLRDQFNETHSGGNPWLWCEGIRVTTATPVDREAALRREDFVGDLLRLSAELRGSDGAWPSSGVSWRPFTAARPRADSFGKWRPPTTKYGISWPAPRRNAWPPWSGRTIPREVGAALPGRLRPFPPTDLGPGPEPGYGVLRPQRGR